MTKLKTYNDLPQHIKDKMKANQDAYRPKPNTNYAVQLFRVSNQEWVDLCYCESVGKAIVTAEKESLFWNAPSRAISKRTNTILAEFNNKEEQK